MTKSYPVRPSVWWLTAKTHKKQAQEDTTADHEWPDERTIFATMTTGTMRTYVAGSIYKYAN